MNLGNAIALAARGFEFKFDKAGKPYILHCLRVMNNLHTDDDELNIIAILHDCIEDGICTLTELIAAGYSQRICIALLVLTHICEDTYEDYIKRVATNPDAIKVKLADLKDNSDITRLKGLTKKDFDRMEKYHKAYVYLSKV